MSGDSAKPASVPRPVEPRAPGQRRRIHPVVALIGATNYWRMEKERNDLLKALAVEVASGRRPPPITLPASRSTEGIEDQLAGMKGLSELLAENARLCAELGEFIQK